MFQSPFCHSYNLDDIFVRVFDVEVEFNCLQKNSLHCHHFFSRPGVGLFEAICRFKRKRSDAKRRDRFPFHRFVNLNSRSLYFRFALESLTRTKFAFCRFALRKSGVRPRVENYARSEVFLFEMIHFDLNQYYHYHNWKTLSYWSEFYVWHFRKKYFIKFFFYFFLGHVG